MVGSLGAQELELSLGDGKEERTSEGSHDDHPKAASPSALGDWFPPLQQLEIGDKRVLTYRVFGASLKPAPAKVILYFHGSPSCHLEAAALHEDANKLNIAVVAPDRPGIGGSTYQRALSLSSFARDCDTLLTLLGVGRVLVIGTSGGGPYATGFAVCCPARVEALALVAALAPTDWRSKEHRDNLKSMEGFDRFQLSAARGITAFVGTPTLWLAHRALQYMANKHPALLLEYAPKDMSPVDAQLMTTDQRMRDNFAGVLQWTYSGSGAAGVAQDVKVLGRVWGINVADITCRTLIFQGTEDKCVPLTHARWYAAKIPGSELVLLEGEGHVTVLVLRAPLILNSLLEAAQGRPYVVEQPSVRPAELQAERASTVSAELDMEAQQVLNKEGLGPPDTASTSTTSAPLEKGGCESGSSGSEGQPGEAGVEVVRVKESVAGQGVHEDAAP